MNRKGGFCLFVLCGVVFVFLTACRVVPYHWEPGTRTITAVSQVFPFPASYRLVHKVRLQVYGRVFDFIGYLAINGSSCRAVGISEIGGTFFDLQSHQGERTVLKNPGRIPAGSLKRGVMRELEMLFTQHPSPGKKDKPLTLKIKTDNANGAPETAQTLLLLQEGVLFSEIRLLSFQQVENWQIPDKLVIHNYYWGYHMEVELLRCDLRPVDNSVFTVQEAQ